MKTLPDGAARMFMVVAETVTPEVAELDAAGRDRLTAIVDTALADRDAATRKQIATFLTVIRLMPVVRYGKTFFGLDETGRTAVLRWLESCPIGLFRKGFWGLKALVFMGYYGQPEHWPEIGYAPDFDGRAGVQRA